MSRDKDLRKTNIATWNLNGKLSNTIQQERLVKDMKSRKVDIGCLQETRWNEDAMMHLEHRTGNIINIKARSDNEHKRYGMGFFVSKEWMKRYEGHEYISDRIATIKFKIHQKNNKFLTIVNVYGPTNQYAKNGNLEEVEKFYEDLKTTVRKKKRSSAIVMVAGDYNAILGQRKDSEGEKRIMGKHTKGHRNINGTYMRDFLTDMNFFASNTAFKHKDHHKATWHSTYRLEDKLIGIHLQLDYIAVQNEHKSMLCDARSFNDQKFQYESDHSMVVMTTQLGMLYRLSRQQRSDIPKKLEIQRLSAAPSAPPAGRAQTEQAAETTAPAVNTTAADFEKNATETLRKINSSSTNMIDLEFFGEEIRKEIEIEIERNKSPKDIYRAIHQSLSEAATNTIPEVPKRINGKIIYSEDSLIKELSKQQLRYRQQLRTIPRWKDNKRNDIHRKRSKLFKEIRNRLRELNTERIEQIARNIENNKDNRKMYDHVKLLRKNRYKEFKINDSNGDLIQDTRDMIKEVEAFYKDFFNDEEVEALDKWQGEKRALTKEITELEVDEAIKRLNNNRAVGPDGLPAEYFKHAGGEIRQEIAKLFNRIFEQHSGLEETQEGYLFPLNKEGKPYTAAQTRPLTFLNTIRKILSNILLARIQESVDRYLSIDQMAYRRGRSTTEAAWTMQWLKATIQRFEGKFHVMKTDLSKAFDCIRRLKLLAIFEENNIGGSDELRILRYLITETTLKTKIKHDSGPAFTTTIGAPQGDALSPMLFIIYLENIMREHKRDYPRLERANDITIQYADDAQYNLFDEDDLARHPEDLVEGCECGKCRAEHKQLTLPISMQNSNMTMNADKTERAELTNLGIATTTLGLLGNSISTSEEIAKRIRNANIAMNDCYNIFLRNNSISTAARVRLYNALVKPHLMYNIVALPLKRTEKDKLNATHRVHLRRAIGNFFPATLHSEELYVKTDQQPLEVDIVYQKWIFLGHVLRQPIETPANRAMSSYFNEYKENGEKKKKRLGKRPTSLAETLVKDILRLDRAAKGRHGVPKNVVKKLPLESLRQLARDKLQWKALCKAIAVRVRFEWLVNYRTDNEQEVPEDSDAHETQETPRLLRNKRY